MQPRDRLVALALSLLLAGATCIPYLLAARLIPAGWTFSGFLLNPIDGFSYLAKMRQGADGAWLFHLPYARLPGPGAFLFAYYLVLGHLSQATGVAPLVVYHAARVIGAALMFFMAYRFFEAMVPDRAPRWVAFSLTLIGSGLGWLGAAFGATSSDLVIPESVPFQSAYSSAHFGLAAAAALAAALVVWGEIRRPSLALAMAFLCGAVMGLVLPFAVISMSAGLGAWLLWEMGVEWRSKGRAAAWSATRSGWLRLLACAAGGAPWGLYDLWVTRASPALTSWASQNQTPSPPIIGYILGYGLVLLLALVAILLAQPHRSTTGRLMMAWMIVGLLLLYAPIGLQRRLSLGLFFPMSGLAAMGLLRLVGRRIPIGLAGAALLLVSLPSNLVVVTAGLTAVARHDSSITLSQAEAAGYAWVAANAAPGELVLAGPVAGNRLPSLANVRVLYGHPFETPDAEASLALVRRLFAWSGEPADGLKQLRGLGVSLVFYGNEERQLGHPSWIDGLPTRFQDEGVSVLEIAAR